jgi:hypothetical protein
MKRAKSAPDLKSEAKANKRARTSAANIPDPDGPIGEWMPSGKDWEGEVLSVQHIEKDEKTGTLWVFVLWKNGKRTKVHMSKIRKHCPRPMLDFYQAHL